MRLPPLVIAHRGASGYRPEHTLAAYELAIAQGADFIEPDLVATRDGELVARHENALAVLDPQGAVNTTDTSTDVYLRPEFANRLTTKTIDGRQVRGWFSEDFTLAELKTLRAVERIPALRPQNAAFDGQFEVPTFTEILELVRRVEAGQGRRIGIYPETKHPTYFQSAGRRRNGEPLAIDLGRLLVAALVAADFTDPERVFIQSFEVANLQALHATIMPRAGVALPLIQLIEPAGAPYDFLAAGDPRTYADLLTAGGLVQIGRYARGIGVPKQLLVPRTAADGLAGPTTLVTDAHAAGLLVHAWTFRAENAFLPATYRSGREPAARGDLQRELSVFLDLGLDGIFTDHPDLGVAACRAHRLDLMRGR